MQHELITDNDPLPLSVPFYISLVLHAKDKGLTV